VEPVMQSVTHSARRKLIRQIKGLYSCSACQKRHGMTRLRDAGEVMQTMRAK
jgi:hypothetical protein